MPRTLTQPYQTTPDNLPVSARPANLKADLPDNRPAESLSPVVKEAAKRAHGKQGVAAAVLGKDEGNFARDVSAERTTIGDLRKLGPEFLVEFGKELLETYGPLATPRARARQTIRTMRAQLEELDQYVEDGA